MINQPLNSNTHAIMFHHFHDETHPVGQGSLSALEFSAMVDWLASRYTILNPHEYLFKLNNQQLKAKDICLTFDDALLCQSEIAAPVLKKRNIQAFFFIYTSHLTGNPDYLEVYRYFRTMAFKTIDQFYGEFFYHAKRVLEDEYIFAEISYQGNKYLEGFPFYTQSDKWFRFLRDRILLKERYDAVMKILMDQHNFNPIDFLPKLWMSQKNILDLSSDGHEIGLHSHNHPTTIHLLNRQLQEKEYSLNHEYLKDILKSPIISMSHPCGNYNQDTLEILSKKGIKIGFRSSSIVKEIVSNLEVPREDHSNVLREMKKLR